MILNRILRTATFTLADQRNMGMSMRVERSSLDQVKARLASRKRQIEVTKQGPVTYDLDARVAALQEEEEDRAVNPAPCAPGFSFFHWSTQSVHTRAFLHDPSTTTAQCADA